MPELHDRLSAVADLAGAGFATPDTAVFAARRRRRARAGVAGAVAVVAVVAAAATLLHAATRGPAPPSALPERGVPVGPITALSGPTARQLTGYRWATAPDAPIHTRGIGVVSVWTGRDVLIWGGGSNRGRRYADGASFDPRTRAWTKLPPSPLSPREDAAYAWTGHELFVWGGWRGGAHLQDGACYDPDTHRWRRLPPLRLDDANALTAVWTGKVVALFSVGARSPTVAVHTYDPAGDQWATGPAIGTTTSEVLDVSATATGKQLYVWLAAQRNLSPGLQTLNLGFVYRGGTWRRTSLLPDLRPFAVGATTWTGDHILFDPREVDCDVCGGVPGTGVGAWVDLRTGRGRPVAELPQLNPGEVFAEPDFVWTGGAALASIGHTTLAWDPARDAWTRLADPPTHLGPTQVWTGDSLLVWGAATTVQLRP